MSSAELPQCPDKFTIALCGKKDVFLRRIDNIILKGTNASVTNLNNFVEREDKIYRIIRTPDFFEECHYSDQLIIDFMALSDPGPHLFILAIDSDNSQEDNVRAQIAKLQDIFGKDVTKNVVVILENQESYNLLENVKKTFYLQMETVNEKLAVECKKWCSSHKSFQFDYKKYSKDAVEQRKNELKHTRNTQVPSYKPGSKGASNQSPSSSQQTDPPAEKAPVQDDGASNQSPSSSQQNDPPAEKAPVQDNGASNKSPSSSQQNDPPAEKAPVQDNGAKGLKEFVSPSAKASVQDTGKRGSGAREDNVFSIILLGQTGTGKSACANTILSAGKHHRDKDKFFESQPSSIPVTTKCEDKMVEIFGMKIRVVDTPDFFYEDQPVDEAELEKCKKYCQEGQCVVLLVMQLGRFTDGEREILENLEEKLGWKIRESTIILFTHGDALKGTVEQFIGERSHLKHTVEACGSRYHVFNNNSKDTKQVTALFEKFQKESFLKLPPHSQCCLL